MTTGVTPAHPTYTPWGGVRSLANHSHPLMVRAMILSVKDVFYFHSDEDIFVNCSFRYRLMHAYLFV